MAPNAEYSSLLDKEPQANRTLSEAEIALKTKNFNSSFASLKELKSNSKRRSQALDLATIQMTQSDGVLLSLPPPMDAQGFFIKPNPPASSKPPPRAAPPSPKSPVPPPRPPRRAPATPN